MCTYKEKKAYNVKKYENILTIFFYYWKGIVTMFELLKKVIKIEIVHRTKFDNLC